MPLLCCRENYNLFRLVGDFESQHRFILDAANEMRRMDRVAEKSQRPASVIWDTAGPDDTPSAATACAEKPAAATAVTIASLVEVPFAPEDAEAADIAQLCASFEWAAHSPCPTVRVWTVLAILYVSPEYRSLVCQNTERGIGIAFFNDFDDWFTAGLCGCNTTVTDKPNSQKKLWPALTPTQLVAETRTFLHELQTNPDVASGAAERFHRDNGSD